MVFIFWFIYNFLFIEVDYFNARRSASFMSHHSNTEKDHKLLYKKNTLHIFIVINPSIHPSIQPPIRSSRRLRRVFQTSRWPYNHSSCKQCGSWPWLICPQPLPGCKRNNAGHGSLRPFVHRLLPDVHFLFGFAVREPSLHHLVQLTTRWWSLNTSTPFFIWVSKTKK